jgi:hypothetical protein
VVGGLVVAVVTAERLVVMVDDSNVDDELLELLLVLLLAVVLVDDELLDDEVDELEVTWSAWARDRLRAADAPEAGTSSESTATAKATRATARVRRRSCEASFTSSSASGFTGREWADSRRTRTPRPLAHSAALKRAHANDLFQSRPIALQILWKAWDSCW